MTHLELSLYKPSRPASVSQIQGLSLQHLDLVDLFDALQVPNGGCAKAIGLKDDFFRLDWVVIFQYTPPHDQNLQTMGLYYDASESICLRSFCKYKKYGGGGEYS